MRRTDVLKLTYAGIFIALSIILTRNFSGTFAFAGVQALRLNLGFVPIMLSGLLLGTPYGAAVGGIADFLGYFVNPGGGPYFPGFTLTSALIGILPPLILRKRRASVFLTFITVAVTTLTATFLNTLWLKILYDKGFLLILGPRVISALIMIPVYTFFIVTLKRFCGKYLLKM